MTFHEGPCGCLWVHQGLGGSRCVCILLYMGVGVHTGFIIILHNIGVKGVWGLVGACVCDGELGTERCA